MKKKVIWMMALFIVTAVAITVSLRFFSGKKEIPTERRETKEYQPIEVSLSVNGSLEPIITPGTPLVFGILIRNAGAAQETLGRVAIEGKKGELDKLVKANEISSEAAQKVIAGDQTRIRKVPALGVTVDATMFSFLQEGKDGLTPLPWQPKLVEMSGERVITLDEKNVAYVTFVVAPELTVGVSEGEMVVVVRFNNTSREAGRWSGSVLSDTVVISVVRETRTREQQFNKQMATIDYFLALKDYGGAEREINQLLTLKPKLTDGLFLRGKALEGKGEFQRALESYDEALSEFLVQNPKLDEPPWEVMRSIAHMREKLGMKEPKESKN